MGQRVFDVAVAAFLLIMLMPLLIVLAAGVALTSKGGVFYRAERAGANGVPFRLWKFRTMFSNRPAPGPAITLASDARVTPFGRWLRGFKLDELPQLFNVITGDMSLVGPRPEHLRYVGLYTPEQRRILEGRPGLTSRASIAYRNEEALLDGADWEHTYLTLVLPKKLQIDLEYLERRTFLSDLRVLWDTARVLVR